MWVAFVRGSIINKLRYGTQFDHTSLNTMFNHSFEISLKFEPRPLPNVRSSTPSRMLQYCQLALLWFSANSRNMAGKRDRNQRGLIYLNSGPIQRRQIQILGVLILQRHYRQFERLPLPHPRAITNAILPSKPLNSRFKELFRHLRADNILQSLREPAYC